MTTGAPKRRAAAKAAAAPPDAAAARRPDAAPPAAAVGFDSGNVLVRRHVRIGGARRVLRLEQAYWSALDEIAGVEHLTIDALCAWARRRRPDIDLARAIRAFCIDWMRAIGDAGAGHDPAS